jgi:hypothetical protein
MYWVGPNHSFIRIYCECTVFFGAEVTILMVIYGVYTCVYGVCYWYITVMYGVLVQFCPKYDTYKGGCNEQYKMTCAKRTTDLLETLYSVGTVIEGTCTVLANPKYDTSKGGCNDSTK